MDYARYETLNITRRGPADSVLDIQMRAANGKLPTAGHAGHRELAEIWRDVSADDSVRCAVLRGEGKGFSGGGDLGLVQDMAGDFETRSRVWKEARDLVYNVINCSKPVVSAMHGPAVGAGLVAGLLAEAGHRGGFPELTLPRPAQRVERALGQAVLVFQPAVRRRVQPEAEGVRALSPSGVLGDPTDAGAGEGRRLIAVAVADLCAFVHDWDLVGVTG